MLGLAAGVDVLPDAADLHVVEVTARVHRAARLRAALAVVARQPHVGRALAGVEAEPVPQRALGEGPRRPRRLVPDQCLDLGERRARCLVELRLDEDLRSVRRLGDGERRVGRAPVVLDECGEGAGEAGVVVGRDLVGHIVAAVVLVGVVRAAGAADERAVEHVPGLDRLVERVQPRPVRGAVVRVLGRVRPDADHVAAAPRVVAQRVVDLPLAERLVPLGARRVVDPVGVGEGHERGVRGVAQRPPRVEDGLAAGGVADAGAVDAHGPVVEPAVRVVDVLLLARRHREQGVGGVALVVPGDGPAVGPGGGLVLGAQARVLRLRLRQVRGVAGGLVQPVRTPDELVLVPGPRAVERLCAGDAVGVVAAVGVREVVQLLGVGHELTGVRGVLVGEDDRGRRHRGRGLGRDVAARAGRVDLVRGPGHGHDLGRAPPLVVRVAVAHLDVQLVRRGVRADEVVVHPAQVVLDLVELPDGRVPVLVRDRAPGQEGRGERHGQAELHVVSGVVPAAGEVVPDVGPVVQRRVATPGHPVVLRQLAGALGLVEEHRGLQGLAVVGVRRRLGGSADADERPRDERRHQGRRAGAAWCGPRPGRARGWVC